MPAGFIIKNNLHLKALDKMSTKTAGRAREKIGLAMLDFMVNGSPRSSATAPIKWGILRASASVFIGNKLIALSPNTPTEGNPTPAKTYNGKRESITVGFNTEYATKQHERKLNPGPLSVQSGNSNPGNQWVLAHLKKDGGLLMKVASEVYKRDF